MLKRIFVIVLSGILLPASFGLMTVQGQTKEDARLAGKARTGVQKIGVGRAARVEVKLRDNTKLKGYISASGEDSFTVMDQETGASKTVAYGEVAQLKRPGGGGLSTRSWIIIGAAVTAAIIIGLTVIGPVLCDGRASC